MYLFPLVLFLLVPQTSCIMRPTQYRRFWTSPFVNEQDYLNYLANKEKIMSFSCVYEIFKVFYIELAFVIPSFLSLSNALKLLLETPSHTLIIHYQSAQELQRGSRVYDNHIKSPQIWSYLNMAQGPRGVTVDSNEVNTLNKTNFVGNRILAVGWTLPEDYKEYQEMNYNESHIKTMSHILGYDRRKRSIVIVFDALLLSHTPTVLQWLPDNMNTLSVLIKLGDYALEQFVNISNLCDFIKSTNMSPFFFDLPQSLQRALIGEEVQTTTDDNNDDDVNGGSQWMTGSFWVFFGLLGVASLLCRRMLLVINFRK